MNSVYPKMKQNTEHKVDAKEYQDYSNKTEKEELIQEMRFLQNQLRTSTKGVKRIEYDVFYPA